MYKIWFSLLLALALCLTPLSHAFTEEALSMESDEQDAMPAELPEDVSLLLASEELQQAEADPAAAEFLNTETEAPLFTSGYGRVESVEAAVCADAAL